MRFRAVSSGVAPGIKYGLRSLYRICPSTVRVFCIHIEYTVLRLARSTARDRARERKHTGRLKRENFISIIDVYTRTPKNKSEVGVLSTDSTRVYAMYGLREIQGLTPGLGRCRTGCVCTVSSVLVWSGVDVWSPESGGGDNALIKGKEDKQTF